jgi:hypothetical protein
LQDALFHKQSSQQQPPAQQTVSAKIADIQQLRSSVASLSQQVQKLQSCTGSPPPKQVRLIYFATLKPPCQGRTSRSTDAETQ